MRTLDEILAKVKAQNTLVASLGALVTGYKEQISGLVAQVMAGTITSPEVQNKLDQIFDTAANSVEELTSILAANTPAGVPTEPPAPAEPLAPVVEGDPADTPPSS